MEKGLRKMEKRIWMMSTKRILRILIKMNKKRENWRKEGKEKFYISLRKSKIKIRK